MPYAAAGAYTVTVTTTDVAGYAAAASIDVQVDPAPDIPVTVAATPADPVAGQAVTADVAPPANAPAVRDVAINLGDGSKTSLWALSGHSSSRTSTNAMEPTSSPYACSTSPAAATRPLSAYRYARRPALPSPSPRPRRLVDACEAEALPLLLRAAAGYVAAPAAAR